MIDAEDYFKIVAATEYRGPIVMHFEYPIQGRTPNNWYRNSIRGQQEDIATLQQWLQQANLT